MRCCALALFAAGGASGGFVKDQYAAVMPKLAAGGVDMKMAGRMLDETDSIYTKGAMFYQLLKVANPVKGTFEDGWNWLTGSEEKKCDSSKQGLLDMVTHYYGEDSYACTKDGGAAGAAATAQLYKAFGLDAQSLENSPLRVTVDCVVEEIVGAMGGNASKAVQQYPGLYDSVQYMVAKIEREQHHPETLADAYWPEFLNAMQRASVAYAADPSDYEAIASRVEKYFLLYVGPLFIPQMVRGEVSQADIESFFFVAFYGNIQWAVDVQEKHGRTAEDRANVAAGKALMKLFEPAGALKGTFDASASVDGWQGDACARDQMVHLYTVWNWRYTTFYYHNFKPDGVRCAPYADAATYMNSVSALVAPVSLALGRTTPSTSFGWLFYRGNILSGMTGSHDPDCAGNVMSFMGDIQPTPAKCACESEEVSAERRTLRGAASAELAMPQAVTPLPQAATAASAPEGLFDKVKLGVSFALAAAACGAGGILVATLRRRTAPAAQEEESPADSHFVELLDNKAEECVQV